MKDLLDKLSPIWLLPVLIGIRLSEKIKSIVTGKPMPPSGPFI